jgi:hypothetical protein
MHFRAAIVAMFLTMALAGPITAFEKADVMKREPQGGDRTGMQYSYDSKFNAT